jgi:hypothetical protein
MSPHWKKSMEHASRTAKISPSGKSVPQLRHSFIEQLERRRLLCVVGAEGYYQGSTEANLYGTEGDDHILINVEGGCSADGDEHWRWLIKYRLNDEPSINMLTEDWGAINLFTLGGNDTVTVEGLREHNLSVDLGSGNDTMTVDYSNGYPYGGFDGPERGIWPHSLITVLGSIGYDTVNYDASPLTGTNPINVDGYIIDSNTYTIAGTRVASGFQRFGQPFFADRNKMQCNSVENIALTGSTATTEHTVVNVDSLVSTSATISTPSSAPTTLTVAPFVGGDVIATGGPGSDVFNIGKQTNGAKTWIDGGGGSNTLSLDGTDGPDTFDVLSNGLITGQTVAGYSNIQALVLDGGLGADTFNLDGSLDVPYSLQGGADSDTITVSPNVPNLPPIDGGLGTNTLVVDHHNILLPVTYTFNGSGLYFSDSLDGFTPNTNLSNISRLRVDAGSSDDTFLFASAFPFAVEAHGGLGDDVFNGAGAAPTTLYGGDGDDEFILGNGNLLSAAPLVATFGEAGYDTITYDDQLSAGTASWTINGLINGSPNQRKVYLGSNEYGYSEFESLRILGGTAGQEYRFTGIFDVSLDIDAGGGGDTMTVGYGGVATFGAPMTLSGAAGNDVFTWKNASTNWGEYIVGVATYPVILDGGSGYNTFNMDETARTNSSVDFYPDRIYTREPALFALGADLNYYNMAGIGLSCSNYQNNIAVYGTSAELDPGNQLSISCGDGNDLISVYPHDAAGNQTINGNLGIGGGPGVDSLTIDDTASSLPLNYTFTNTFGPGTQNISGLGTGAFGAGSDLDAINLRAGDGDDTFKVNSLRSGQNVSVYGGGGNDLMDFGANSLAGNVVMGLGSFRFDGQNGIDRFNINNRTDISQWTYSRGTGQLRCDRTTIPYTAVLNDANIEEMYVYAGPAGDTFQAGTGLAPGIAPGTHTTFVGAGGVDIFQPGQVSFGLTNQSLIKGKLTFDAGSVAQYGPSGGGNVVVSATAQNAAITAHLTATTLGALPDDTLFGPGGSIEFFNATSISLTMGNGADTVFAQPNLTAPVSIVGGGPTTAPGDSINLALAGAVNYVPHGTAASGNVTSDNLKTLSYSGFETGPTIDDVAPAVVSAGVNIDGGALARTGLRGRTPPRQQTVDVQFSETMGQVTPASLSLTNLTTGEVVPPENIAVAFDATSNISHFTFPGYVGGILPDGNYHGTLLASQTADSFGNALAADAPFDFFVLAGDANHDRIVDVSDLGVLATNWQTSDKLFSEGDFNYDGVVDVSDLGILATNWQVSLPAPTGVRLSKARPSIPFAQATGRVGLPAKLSRSVKIATPLSGLVAVDQPAVPASRVRSELPRSTTETGSLVAEPGG